MALTRTTRTVMVTVLLTAKTFHPCLTPLNQPGLRSRRHGKVGYLPMLPQWNLSGLIREVTYSKDTVGNSIVVTEEFSNFESLNAPPLPPMHFTGPPNQGGYQTGESTLGIIQFDPFAYQKKSLLSTWYRKLSPMLTCPREQGKRLPSIQKPLLRPTTR